MMTRANPDATVFISTLILIYTVFLTVYGVILPQLLEKKRRLWIWLMFSGIVIAVMVDSYRILNSVGDLYLTTIDTFSAKQVDDASNEFVWWFIGNVCVVAVLLIALPFLPTENDPK